MAKHLVALGRPTGNGYERVEIGNLIMEVTGQFYNDPEVTPFISDIVHIPIQKFPTSLARNTLVDKCQKYAGPAGARVDYLMMVDVDGAPRPGTFKAMFNFLRQQPVPSVVGAPYISGDGSIQVFHFDSAQVHFRHGLNDFGIKRYSRELAALKQGTGFERVACVGTHCVMFDMRVFDDLKRPYFMYASNEIGTECTETEDCYLMRHLFHKGTPIFCAWDYPAVHYKELPLEIPTPIGLDQIPEFYQRKVAAAEAVSLKSEEKWDKDAVAALRPNGNGEVTPLASPSDDRAR